MFEHSGGVGGGGTYNNLGTLFEYGTVCRAKPCCKLRDMSTLIIPERPFSPKILLSALIPR